MLVCDRQTSLAYIKFLGSQHCAYQLTDWPNRSCDCKYGADESTRPGSGQTGCPELATLYAIVAALNDEEWGLLIARGYNVSSGTGGLPGSQIGQAETYLRQAINGLQDALGEARRAQQRLLAIQVGAKESLA